MWGPWKSTKEDRWTERVSTPKKSMTKGPKTAKNAKRLHLKCGEPRKRNKKKKKKKKKKNEKLLKNNYLFNNAWVP